MHDMDIDDDTAMQYLGGDKSETQQFKVYDSKNGVTSGKHGITSILMLTITVTTLGCSLPVGHALGVLNTPQEIMREWVQKTLMEQYNVHLSPTQDVILWSVIVSIFGVGAAVAATMGATLANATGRCRAVLIILLLNLISSIMFICCKIIGSVELLLMGRLLTGITTGLSTSIVPLYLSELAPKGLAGVMGVLLPFGICAGIVMSQITGMDIVMGTQNLWPFLVGGFGIYVIIALLFYPLLPESPAYCFLVLKDDLRGRKELQRLRVDHSHLTEEALEMKLATTKHWNLKQTYARRELRLPLLLVAMLNMAQQLSGIIAVFFYSTIIFNDSGLTQTESQIAAICAGLINWLMHTLAVPLIKYCGRRQLILWSIGLSIVFQVILVVALHLIPTTPAAGFVAIAALLAYILAFGIGLGPVPFMIATELFPVGPRSVGLAVGGTFNWGSNLFVGLLFPILQQAAGEYSFCVFIILLCLLGAFFYKFLPETLIKEDPTLTVNNNT